MNISIIAEQLVNEKVILHYPKSMRVLSGGTTSTVYLLDGQYVVKLNESQVIREEAYFLQFYESKSYGLLSVGTVFVTSVCGILFAEKGFTVIPMAVTAVYLLTLIGLLIENKKVDHYQQKSA
ncbi:hypothetical protein CN425_13710 [Bacillus cereus]|uniref:Uncharacterized protein n=1 Tax=Bacillus cereus TaxID=1396 RepID=A0A2A8PVD1_BACCE|nr:hypothetical protein CN425_13710 [Bacillus cereus]